MLKQKMCRMYVFIPQTQVLFPDLRENQKVREMGSWLVGNWPSFDPHNFSQLRPNDPSKKTPITYHPTHERTLPPPDQVISSEAKNILLRQFYQRSDEKLRPKRAAPENLAPEQECKHPRASGPSSSEPPP